MTLMDEVRFSVQPAHDGDRTLRAWRTADARLGWPEVRPDVVGGSMATARLGWPGAQGSPVAGESVTEAVLAEVTAVVVLDAPDVVTEPPVDAKAEPAVDVVAEPAVDMVAEPPGDVKTGHVEASVSRPEPSEDLPTTPSANEPVGVSRETAVYAGAHPVEDTDRPQTTVEMPRTAGELAGLDRPTDESTPLARAVEHELRVRSGGQPAQPVPRPARTG